MKQDNITLALDVAMTTTPVVSEKGYIDRQIVATFFNTDQQTKAPGTPVAIPTRVDSGKDFQFFLTDYTVQSLLFSRYQAQQTDNLTDLLSLANLTLTTDDLALAFPQFVTKYGSGVAVDALYQFTKDVPSFKFTADNAQISGSNIITLQVKGEKALVALNENANLATHLFIKDAKLFGKIDNYSTGKITIQSTTLGVDPATLVSQFETFAKNTVESINAKLAAGIDIPTLEGIVISDGEIKNFDGYLHLGINLSQATHSLEIIQ